MLSIVNFHEESNELVIVYFYEEPNDFSILNVSSTQLYVPDPECFVLPVTGSMAPLSVVVLIAGFNDPLVVIVFMSAGKKKRGMANIAEATA